MADDIKIQRTGAPAQGIDPAAVLAVIPALNEARHIESCIRSLMCGDADLKRIKLVVADGGSTDETRLIVQRLQADFANLHLMDNPKKLQSAALNLAAETMASGQTDILVRCDAHSIYPENFILDVANGLRRANAASLVVPMDATGETCFQKANAWIVDTPLGSGGSAHRGGRASRFVDHGHHAAFDLAIFRKLGGYDETFSHNEDAEYDYRLAAAGGRIFMDADTRIRYFPRGDLKTLAKQYFRYGKGRARTLLKHGMRLKPRQLIPVLALLGSLAGILAAPLFPPAILLPLGYACVLLGASVFVAIWRRSLCGLFAGVASGTMHLSWAAGFLHQYLKVSLEKNVK